MGFSDTKRFNELVNTHTGSELEKLIKTDKYCCVLLEEQLKVDKNFNTRWFYQVMTTIFYYYLIHLPEIEKYLKEVQEKRVECVTDWEVIVGAQLKQYSQTVMTNSSFSDYYEETLMYIEVRKGLREWIEKRVAELPVK